MTDISLKTGSKSKKIVWQKYLAIEKCGQFCGSSDDCYEEGFPMYLTPGRS
jgi:hypothetical protein